MPTRPGQAAIWPLTPVPQRQATCRGPERSRRVGGSGSPELQTARRRPRTIEASRRSRRPEAADGTSAVQSNRGISAAPVARNGRQHAGGPKRSRHPASLARRLRLCGNERSFLDFPEESDEMTWHFSPAPSRGPILIWETAGRLIAVKRSTLRSSFLPRHFDSAN